MCNASTTTALLKKNEINVLKMVSFEEKKLQSYRTSGMCKRMRHLIINTMGTKRHLAYVFQKPKYIPYKYFL